MNLKCFVIIIALCITAIYGNNEEYEFFPKIDMLYKYHSTPQKWNDARKTCLQEGATLAMPLNEKELAALLIIFNRHPTASISGTPHTDLLFLGFHDIFSEGEYITLKGLPIHYYFHTWAEYQPDNFENEDCGTLHRVKLLNDFPCAAACVFICQKEISSVGNTSNGYAPNDKAYIYAPHLKRMYKIHLNIKKWAEARTICDSEGGNLAIINSVAEKDFLVKMFNEPTNKVLYAIHPDHALLGFHDQFQEGDFITVKGNSLQSAGFTDWARGQPDNHTGIENCGSMHSSGLLHDFPCGVPAIFFCEKAVTMGYEFFPKINMLYKYHSTPQKWNDATKTCIQEGATLAMPLNAEELGTLLIIFNRHPATSISGTPYTDMLLLGFHDIFSEGEFITTEGLPIHYYFHTWAGGQPDNLGNEDCGTLYRSGLLNDLSCAAACVFICQKEISPGRTISEGYAPNDIAYIYAPHLRSTYKIHLNMKNWAEARLICESEGGYLAIINSVAEKDFLVEMFNDPENRILYAVYPAFALLGFHDQFQEADFVTVEGNSLQSTDFTEWAEGQPDSHTGIENCGSMHSSGLLHDFPCDVPAVFFCEKTVTVGNVNGM